MPALKSQSISSLVRNSRFPYLAGRAIGVKLRFVQIPCKSGWPSGVYDNFQGFFSTVLVAALALSSLLVLVCAFPTVFAVDVVWAGTSAGTAKAAAIAAARVPARERLRIVLPSIHVPYPSCGQYVKVPLLCGCFSSGKAYEASSPIS